MGGGARESGPLDDDVRCAGRSRGGRRGRPTATELDDVVSREPPPSGSANTACGVLGISEVFFVVGDCEENVAHAHTNDGPRSPPWICSAAAAHNVGLRSYIDPQFSEHVCDAAHCVCKGGGLWRGVLVYRTHRQVTKETICVADLEEVAEMGTDNGTSATPHLRVAGCLHGGDGRK